MWNLCKCNCWLTIEVNVLKFHRRCSTLLMGDDRFLRGTAKYMQYQTVSSNVQDNLFNIRILTTAITVIKSNINELFVYLRAHITAALPISARRRTRWWRNSKWRGANSGSDFRRYKVFGVGLWGSPAGVEVSNSSGSIHVCLLWTLWSIVRGLCDGPIPRAGESYRLSVTRRNNNPPHLKWICRKCQTKRIKKKIKIQG